MTLEIRDQEGNLVNSWPLDNDVIGPAVAVEVELHNRDNPDDPWEIVQVGEE